MIECIECGSAHQFHFNDCSRAEGRPTMKTEMYQRGYAAGLEAAAVIADGVKDEWLTNAANIARADEMVGGLAQSVYADKAALAERVAAAIRAKAGKGGGDDQ